MSSTEESESSAPKKYIRVKTIISIVNFVPVNEDYYPGMDAEAARKYEQDLPEEDKQHNAVEYLLNDGHADFAHHVMIVDEDTYITHKKLERLRMDEGDA